MKKNHLSSLGAENDRSVHAFVVLRHYIMTAE
jgi:hypothetical protein